MELINFFRAYAVTYALRLGWDGQYDLGKFMAKRIKQGSFRTDGKSNLNPVLLRLNGGYELYWADVIPVIRNHSVPTENLLKLLKTAYINIMINGNYGKDQALLTTSGNEPETFTLRKIENYFKHVGKELL